MFKTIYKPVKTFNTEIIKPNTKAIYSIKEDYFCPIADEFIEYKIYEGTIINVTEEQIKFVSNDTHINLYSETEHPDIDKWLTVEDIDGYWFKLKLL